MASKVCRNVFNIVDTSISIGLAIPGISNVIASIDRIMNLIHKAISNKALCEFIGERLNYAKSVLRDSDSIDKDALESYSKVLTEIEDGIKAISGDKKRFKAWVLSKKILNAKEAEEKLLLLFKKLDAANNQLIFSVLKDTHRNVKEIKEEIPGQLQNLVRLLTMKLDIDNYDWKVDDVLLDSNKIKELRNQPKVIRDKIEKKKYLTQDVALKPLDSCDSNSCKSIKMFKLLADCKNVIKFFGVYRFSGDQYLVTEWCEHGNLEEYLMKNPDLDWNIKVNIATGVANGLVFCHDRDIFHHDVRSSNIMLDAHLCAKLSNFELSRRENDNTVPGFSFADAAKYLAPEKIESKKNPYTKKCDIYSLGIVLWVIAMQEKPYADMKNFKQIENFVLQGNRPEPVDEIPIKYKKIMEKAWDHDSNNRPDANKVYEELSKCLEDDDIYPVDDDDEHENLVPVSDSDYVQRDDSKIKYDQAVNYHKSNNHEEAWPIFCELSTSGHKESLYYLGYYYEHGYVIPKDSKRALKYYRESADKGCNRAAYCYAEACLKLAHEYMEKAAQLKQFKAGIKLSEYYFPSPARDTFDKLLKYLDADDIKLQKSQSEDAKMYQGRIRGLRDEIKRRQTK